MQFYRFKLVRKQGRGFFSSFQAMFSYYDKTYAITFNMFLLDANDLTHTGRKQYRPRPRPTVHYIYFAIRFSFINIVPFLQ